MKQGPDQESWKNPYEKLKLHVTITPNQWKFPVSIGRLFPVFRAATYIFFSVDESLRELITST